MAIINWTGNAAAVAQIDTLTISGTDPSSGDTFTVTINGKAVSITGQTTTAGAATALQAALAASTFPEFAEITWANPSSGTVTGTSKTAGRPFTITSFATSGSSTVGTSTTTAGSGPNDLSIPANYDGGALPVNGDTLVVQGNVPDILYGLDALSGVTLAYLRIVNWTGQFGLPRINSTGRTPYAEYRPTYAAFGATLCDVGTPGGGQGPSLFKWNSGSVQTTLTVYSSGTGVEGTGFGAVIFKGTHTSNVVDVRSGSASIAQFGGETASVATLQTSGGTVSCGAGVTLTTVRARGGTGSIGVASAVTTLLVEGGTANVEGSGAVTNLTANAGTVNYQGSGTITTLYTKGKVNFGQLLNRTVTNCTIAAGGSISDPGGRTTFTNGIVFETGVRVADVTLDVGTGRTLSIS